MHLLALDAALARCSVALLRDDSVLAERQDAGGRGQPAVLPALVRGVMEDAGVAIAALDAVGVTIGPGSFTGLRAALALAHGLALGAGCKLVAVTVPEALEAALPDLDGRAVWAAIDNRRGRVFLDLGGTLAAYALDRLPPAGGPVAVTGDAAIAVAARLAARGDDVRLTDSRLPLARFVAVAARRRLAAGLPMLAAQPLYVDPPEAKLPAGGLRPSPLAP